MQWKYKAFDNNMQTHEGLVDGDNVEEIAITLRQKGLQLIELVSANNSDCLYYNKVGKFKKLRNSCKIHSHQEKSRKRPISLFEKLKKLLFR
jgi:type II secretory pathway component PulF